jgi:RHS repeat-associated protein
LAQPILSADGAPDALGRVQQVREYWNGNWYSTVDYTYDYQGQLVKEVRSGTHAYQIEYWYNVVGNRLQRARTVDGQTTVDTLVYDDANRVKSLNGASWQHDANGNVVMRMVDGVVWQFEYDDEDNVVAIKRDGAPIARYAYDGLGRQVKKVSPNETVNYLYAGDIVVAEQINGEWVPWIYGLSLVQRGMENQHWNWRGDLVATSAWSDPTQAPMPARITDSFGNTVYGSPTSYDWNGAWLYRNELVEASGLVKVGERWYDSVVGRFLQRDPIINPFEPLSFKLYLYCLSDPINAVDEDGNIPKWLKDAWDWFKGLIGLGGGSGGSGSSGTGGSGGSAPGAGGGGGTVGSGGSGGSGNGNTIVVQPGSGTTVIVNGNGNTIIIQPLNNPTPHEKKPKPGKPKKPKKPRPGDRKGGCCCGCSCCHGHVHRHRNT